MTRKDPLKVAAFVSGSGTNLRRIIELQESLGGQSPFVVALVFTDTKDIGRCNAKAIAAEYNIPFIEKDIKDYYGKRGYPDTKNMVIREDYDRETASVLRVHGIDLIAMCGYLSIVTSHIYSGFVTLNIHPGDLTRTDQNGKRIYAGCIGVNCIRKAIENGEREVRSTVHFVNGELDGGAVIALSDPVLVSGGDSASLLEELKRKEWIIYPEVIRRLAGGVLRKNGIGV
ncbi:hypothetical protein HYU11_00460 [Candidatus Woesearchaeota archaeon]|nr:hypothetical protein [Candidatus Woesearchaeota archaeon]